MRRVILFAVSMLGLGATGAPSTAQTSAQDLARATEMCREGKGQAIGCARLGLSLYEGDGAPRDVAGGLRYLEMACRMENADSCEIAGAHYMIDSPARDLVKARSLYSASCGLDSVEGCLRAASAYIVADDMKKGLEYAEKGCGGIDGKRHGKACDMLARSYRDGTGVKADPAKAHRYFSLACRRDQNSELVEPNYEACVWAADAEEEGKGIRQDYIAARQGYRMACTMRVPSGCNNLARMLSGGRGGNVDIDEAVRTYDRACRFGSRAGCANLEALREAGHGQAAFAEFALRTDAEKAIPADLPEATRYLLVLSALDRGEHAAVMPILDSMIGDGNADAMYRKAVMYFTGEGLPQDYKRALNLAERAGRLDHPYALYLEGQMNLDGLGTTASPAWAEATFRRASELGVAEATPIYQQLRANREAFFAERQAQLVAQNRQNQAAASSWAGTALESAWKGYFARQAANAGNTVCATILQGGRMTRECMSEEHFDSYYRP